MSIAFTALRQSRIPSSLHCFAYRIRPGSRQPPTSPFHASAMSTFKLPREQEPGHIPVTLPNGLKEENVLGFYPFHVSLEGVSSSLSCLCLTLPLDMDLDPAEVTSTPEAKHLTPVPQ